MRTDKEVYFNLLKIGGLSNPTMESVLNHMDGLGLYHSPIPSELKKKNKKDEKITDYLTKLNLWLIEGNPSWEGLLVGFPGNVNQLATKSVGTPYLREILYPILDLHHRLLETHKGKRLPCIYFVGDRFTDVILRKFELLEEVVPNIIVLTHDLYECSKNKKRTTKNRKITRKRILDTNEIKPKDERGFSDPNKLSNV